VTRDQQAVRGEIKAPVPLMLKGIAKEDTLTIAEGELMGSSGREVGIACIPENLKVGVGGSGAKEDKVGVTGQ
jgi:hypothetical protein